MGIFGITRAPAVRSPLENPSVPITMEELALLTTYGPTRSGVQVSESTALTFTAVFSAVRIISEAIGAMPLRVYQRIDMNGKEGKKVADTMPAHTLLSQQANPEMTAAVFKEVFMTNLLLWGFACARIQRDRANRPIALWPLLSRTVHPERKGGQLQYRVDDGGTFDPEEIIHVPGLSINGITSLSPIGYAKEAIALGKAAELYGAAFFGNGGTVQGILENAGELSDKAYVRLKESWNQQHQGVANAHKIAVLEGGTKYTQIGIPPEEAQFLMTRQFQVKEVARIYRVPLHMMADLEKSSFSNIEQQSLEFSTFTLATYTEKIEQETLRKLLPSDEYYTRFDDRRLLRGDIRGRLAFYTAGRQWGFLSRNDIRQMEDMDPIAGGDDYLTPVNMVPNQPPNGGPGPSPTADDVPPSPKSGSPKE